LREFCCWLRRYIYIHHKEISMLDVPMGKKEGPVSFFLPFFIVVVVNMPVLYLSVISSGRWIKLLAQPNTWSFTTLNL